jgi:carboxyl-terminal processing protease
MRRILLAFVLVGGVLSAGLLSGAALIDSAWGKGSERYATLDTLAQAIHHIELRFVDEVQTRDLIYGGVKGMTKTLDAHSTFLTPEEMKQAESRTEGWYTGIGVELTTIQGKNRVSRVIPDSPADTGGVAPGDEILSIDDTDVAEMTLLQIGDKLKGKEGSEVTLSVMGKSGTQRKVRLRRERVRDKTVRIISGKPGFPTVQISHFQRNTAADLETALGELAKRRGKTRGLIIDLRDNPGGLLDEAVAVVDIFLSQGLIYESRGRDDAIVSRADAKAGSRWERTPLVILVNSKSASASEIVAGALQAHGRAKVVGTPTYGKGSVQRMYLFEDGSGLKLTEARYHLAGGKLVADNKGIDPDVVVRTPSKRSQAASRLTELTLALPQDKRDEAHKLIDTLQDGHDAVVSVQPDPQLEAAWKIVHAIP